MKHLPSPGAALRLLALLSAGLAGPGLAQPAAPVPPAVAPVPEPTPPVPASPAPTGDMALAASLQANLGRMLLQVGGYLGEEDRYHLYLFLRDSIIDALTGTDQASLPPDLAFKLAVLRERFRKEGNAYLLELVRQYDAEIAESLKGFLDSMPPPAEP